MKKIIILGSNGMLGQMVNSFFVRNGYDVTCYNERFNEDTRIEYLNFLNTQDASIIINCVGRIKQKSNDIMSLLLSNSILPLELARNLRSDHILVHPSTDCVFSGASDVKYSINSLHDANDVYGWSKSFGEKALLSRDNTLIIRVSIIGPDKHSNSGLLAWFLSLPPNSEIKGYNNHYWNGITTLEWCNQLLLFSELIDFELPFKAKVYQLGTERVYSKYEIMNLFQKTFNTQHSIIDFSCDEFINRSLISDLKIVELDYQLSDLKSFMSI